MNVHNDHQFACDVDGMLCNPSATRQARTGEGFLATSRLGLHCRPALKLLENECLDRFCRREVAVRTVLVMLQLDGCNLTLSSGSRILASPYQYPIHPWPCDIHPGAPSTQIVYWLSFISSTGTIFPCTVEQRHWYGEVSVFGSLSRR